LTSVSLWNLRAFDGVSEARNFEFNDALLPTAGI
jgi:hypothetical protein